MSYVVRPGTVADAAVIAEFNRAMARETEAKELDPETLRAGVTAALNDPDFRGPYLLACAGPEVVGQLFLTREWSDWRNGWFLWIQSVYVRPDHRGRGLFRLLLERVRADARAAGDVVGLRLYVEAHNHRAGEVYRCLGFIETPYRMMELDVSSD